MSYVRLPPPYWRVCSLAWRAKRAAAVASVDMLFDVVSFVRLYLYGVVGWFDSMLVVC